MTGLRELGRARTEKSRESRAHTEKKEPDSSGLGLSSPQPNGEAKLDKARWQGRSYEAETRQEDRQQRVQYPVMTASARGQGFHFPDPFPLDPYPSDPRHKRNSLRLSPICDARLVRRPLAPARVFPPVPHHPPRVTMRQSESDGGSDSGTGVVSLVGFWAKSTFGVFWIWQLETSTAPAR
ncbi:hypothetical protein BKA56DRAFT_607490 [Ilyonectria sp. MPI-CAGE-AT-0026]|nr:hypothetical protein BKA56DRAFT_607490 [Ilyonectria sp. MPI-CAGE-AT-0026]